VVPKINIDEGMIEQLKLEVKKQVKKGETRKTPDSDKKAVFGMISTETQQHMKMMQQKSLSRLHSHRKREESK
jgi:hypothetical protein